MSAFSQIIKLAIPGSIAFAFFPQGTIHNESKRRFYEDDENITPVPGTIVPASASEIESLGPNKLIDGTSVRSPASLEKLFNNIRKGTVSALKQAGTSVDNLSSDYYKVEQKLTDTVADLHDKREDLLPGSLYVITAFLTGSIAARRRNIFLRIGAPLVFGLAAFKWALPSTFANSTNFAYKLERQNIPAVANAQDSIVSGVEKTINDVDSAAKSTKSSLNNGIKSTRKYIASVTGLKIDEPAIENKKD